MELFELAQISKTIRCHSCLKHLTEELKFCGCGVCLQPDEDTINRIKARFQALKAPCYLARLNRSRGKKRRDSEWQQDHWKAIDAREGARKHNNHPTILSRWQNDEQYRTSELAIGWTENYCRYLDYLTTIDISRHAPYHQRKRYESTITVKLQSGPMKIREDYRATAKVLLSLREEQGGNSSPEESQDEAEKYHGPRTSTKTGMVEQELGNILLKTDFVLFVIVVAELGGKTLNGMTLVGKITGGTNINGEITNGDQ